MSYLTTCPRCGGTGTIEQGFWPCGECGESGEVLMDDTERIEGIEMEEIELVDIDKLEQRASEIMGLPVTDRFSQQYTVSAESSVHLGAHADVMGFGREFGSELVEVLVNDYHEFYKANGIWFAVAHAPAIARVKAFIAAYEKKNA